MSESHIVCGGGHVDQEEQKVHMETMFYMEDPLLSSHMRHTGARYQKKQVEAGKIIKYLVLVLFSPRFFKRNLFYFIQNFIIKK